MIPNRKLVNNPVKVLKNHRNEKLKKIAKKEKLVFEKLGGKIALKKDLPKDYFVENKEELINYAKSNLIVYDEPRNKPSNNPRGAKEVKELRIVQGAVALGMAAFLAGLAVQRFTYPEIPNSVVIACMSTAAIGLGTAPLYVAIVHNRFKREMINKGYPKNQLLLNKIIDENEARRAMKGKLDSSFVNDAWEKGYSEKEIISAFSNEEFTEEVQDMVRNQLLGIYYDEVEDGIARLDTNIPERYRTMRSNINAEIANKKASISQDEQTL